jgi:hypothetical protein
MTLALTKLVERAKSPKVGQILMSATRFLKDKRAVQFWDQFVSEEGVRPGYFHPAFTAMVDRKIPIPHEYFLNFLTVEESQIAAIFKSVEMSCWFGWSKYKSYCTINKNLWEALIKMPFPDKYSSDQISLPDGFSVFEVPSGNIYGLYFDRLQAGHGAEYELRINQLIENECWVMRSVLHLKAGESIDQAFDGSCKLASSNADIASGGKISMDSDVLKQYFKDDDIRGLLNTLLYLNSEPDDFIIRKPQKKKKKSPTRSRIKQSVVGSKYDFVIRNMRKEDSQTTEKGDSSKGKNKPHYRSGYIRTYWTGKGRKIARVVIVEPYCTGGLTVSEWFESLEKKEAFHTHISW